jgi:two-component system chemotaxis response regulator CheY
MKIMVVDDSMAMRMIVLKTLREAGFEGFEAIQAEDGAKALELIKADRPDLVLCDWNMPNMTGLELLQALNDEEIKPPFGFVTPESTPAMRDKAMALGAQFLIVKPFTTETFKTTLDAYIG